MSHLWDGFRIDATTFDQAMNVVDAFRPTALDMHRRWNAGLLARMTATLIDEAHANGRSPPTRPLQTVSQQVDERRLAIVRTERRDPQVDGGFRLTLLRDQDEIYGLVDTERADWRDALLSLRSISDFRWWNGSDGPDDVPAVEWAAREVKWRKLIPGLWPAERGIVVMLTPRYVHSTANEVLSSLPDMEDRRRRVASGLAVARRMTQMTPRPDDADAAFAAASAASIWLCGKEGIAERDRIMSGLDLPRIDMAMLIGDVPVTK